MKAALISFFALLLLSALSLSCQPAPQMNAGPSGASKPSTSQPAPSPGIILSRENVQRVVDRFISNNRGNGCSTEPCKAEVVSVREIPAQNQAVATLNVDRFVFQPGDRSQEYIYSGEAKATFDRGTDGVWSMSRLSFTKYGHERSWTEMRGYDIR